MPWPGDEGEQRWEQAWKAIKRCGAPSGMKGHTQHKKSETRPRISSMAVLVQEVVNADYALHPHN